MCELKKTGFLAALLLTLTPILSFGQISKLDRMMSRECKPVEFAELKTFTKKDLIERFCESKFIWKINADSVSERLQIILSMEKIANEKRSLGMIKEAMDTDMSISEMKKQSVFDQNHKAACSAEVDRIAIILKSKAVNNPSCTD